MGAGNTACSCDGNKENEVVGFTPRAASDAVRPVPQEKVAWAGGRAPVPAQLERLRGSWRTEGDGQLMGEIVDGTILWDEAFNHPQTELRLARAGHVEMELMGTTHQAAYHDGPPAILRWSDGETWVRDGQ